MLYASLADEVPTLGYIADAARTTFHGSPRRFVLPCVVSDTDMELRLYTGEQDLEVRGKYHIPEPVGPLFTDIEHIDAAIIPGMAFDSDGHRLGRGKGYYDRFLAHPAFRHIPKYGVCFDFQLVSHVPAESHDCIMDHLIVIPTR